MTTDNKYTDFIGKRTSTGRRLVLYAGPKTVAGGAFSELLSRSFVGEKVVDASLSAGESRVATDLLDALGDKAAHATYRRRLGEDMPETGVIAICAPSLLFSPQKAPDLLLQLRDLFAHFEFDSCEILTMCKSEASLEVLKSTVDQIGWPLNLSSIGFEEQGITQSYLNAFELSVHACAKLESYMMDSGFKSLTKGLVDLAQEEARALRLLNLLDGDLDLGLYSDVILRQIKQKVFAE